MKEKILTNWTLGRALYLIIGIGIIIHSVINQQWAGVAFGGYFAAMGLFAFGCAAGNCLGGNCTVKPKQKSTIRDMDFEEAKTK